jgi:hypothetical protein
VPIPARYHSPANIQKYTAETSLGLWLEDYRLGSQASGADDDAFIIHNLPQYLANLARTWLEHLPPNKVRC